MIVREQKNQSLPTDKQILITAGEMFVQYGLRSISIEDICNQVRISKKTFYVYYSSKEELIATLIDRHQTEVERYIEQETDGKSVVEIFLFFTQQVHMLINNQHIRFKRELQKYYPHIYEDIERRVLRNRQENILRYIKEGIKQGYFRADIIPDLMALYFIEMQNVLARMLEQDFSVNRRRLSKKVIVNDAIKMFAHMCFNDEGKQRLKQYLEENNNKQQ
ncbi:MAG: TetR/AcrR family transcriptional regulator [Paludibacteraceae bacterium]|nr:TetR/AcrR family transcriptional regulator [Paludibacteraceae bacterium]